MPRMDQAPSEKKLIKALIIADGKVGKTRFAGMAAAAGFNVLYFDGDVGTPTLSQLPMEAKRNLYLLPVHDTITGGSRDSRFIETIEQFSSNIEFRWNDTQSRMASAKDKTDTIWKIQPAKMDENCIMVWDSWTSLTESIQLRSAIAEGIDLTDSTLADMRAVYRGSGLKATQMLQIVRSMPCHVIVLAHPDEYEHRVAPDGKRIRDINEKDMIIEWTKMIAKSTSRPHALQMPKYFTDVAWMEVSPTGIRKLDFRAKATRISGGHFSDIKDVDEYSFANLVKEIGGLVPDPAKPASVDSWLTIVPPGEAEPVEQKVLGGGETGQVKMTSIFGAKKEPTAAV
jgi:hypothetical protein